MKLPTHLEYPKYHPSYLHLHQELGITGQEEFQEAGGEELVGANPGKGGKYRDGQVKWLPSHVFPR